MPRDTIYGLHHTWTRNPWRSGFPDTDSSRVSLNAQFLLRPDTAGYSLPRSPVGIKLSTDGEARRDAVRVRCAVEPSLALHVATPIIASSSPTHTAAFDPMLLLLLLLACCTFGRTCNEGAPKKIKNLRWRLLDNFTTHFVSDYRSWKVDLHQKYFFSFDQCLMILKACLFNSLCHQRPNLSFSLPCQKLLKVV